MKVEGEQLVIAGVKEGEHYALHDMSGRSLASGSTTAACTGVDISGIPHGIYVITVNGKSLKIKI